MQKVTVAQLKQLIGNQDAYAEQWNSDSGTGWSPRYEKVTPKVLADHLAQKRTIGTYLVTDHDKARTLVLDFDSGVDSGKAHDDCDSVVSALEGLGVPRHSMAVEFSGKKGYHIWVLMAGLVSASSLRRLGRAALTLAGVTDAEIYPKQNAASKLGNLIKLPNGIHQGSGKANPLLDPFPVPMATSTLDKILEQVPEEAIAVGGGAPPPALECMEHIQNGVSEGGRNNALYHLATMLRRASVADEWVTQIVHSVAKKCNPPVDDTEVGAILQSSYTGGPICSSLPTAVQCTDCPVRRTKGLYLNNGQLRYGMVGEMVVVKLKDRRPGGVVEISHPDLASGLVRIK